MAITVSQNSSVVSTNRVIRSQPATFARMSIPPHARVTSSTPAATLARRVTSMTTGIAWPPAAVISAATASAPAPLTSATATRAPSAAARRHTALPIPLAPPGPRGPPGGPPGAPPPGGPAGRARDQCHPALEDHQHSLLPGPEASALGQLLPTPAAVGHPRRETPGAAGRALLRGRSPQRLDPPALPGLLPQRAVVHRALLNEGRHPLPRLAAGEVQAEPVPGVSRREVPGEVLPEVHLLLGVPQALGKLVDEGLAELVHGRVQLRPRHHPVHEAPLQRLLRRH